MPLSPTKRDPKVASPSTNALARRPDLDRQAGHATNMDTGPKTSVSHRGAGVIGIPSANAWTQTKHQNLPSMTPESHSWSNEIM